jgi:hypothetical protein
MYPAAIALLVLQCFVVLFVALHNWIPLGALNSVKGVRFAFSYRQTVCDHVN